MRSTILATALCAHGFGVRAAPSEDEGSTPAFDNNGEDITRPESETKFEIRPERRLSGVTDKTERDYLNLRVSGLFDLKSAWGVSWFAQLPLVYKVTTTEDGTLDRASGLGDMQLQAVLYHPINPRWAYGIGLNLIAPSAEDSLGSGKWQLRPLAGIRYTFLEFGPDTYFVPKIRYAISAGGDPSRRDISEAQIAPTLNIGLPNHWFVTLYPSQDIRINFGEPASGQTGRLFLPFDAAVGRKLGEALTMSLEFGFPIIRDYPVYTLKTRLRLIAKF